MAAGGEYCRLDVVLRDGRLLRTRPIRPDDKKRLETFFYKLSPKTRYLRFHYTKDTITEAELAHFTEVTPPGRGAFVATTGNDESEEIIAVGRWDMLKDGSAAEIAFAVDDNTQMRGIGTVLLEEIAGAATSFKIPRLAAFVLPENSRMIEVFEESGFKYTKTLKQGIYEFSFDLKEQEEYSRRQALREHIGRSAGVRMLLTPKRVAVVGASRNAQSVGGALFRNLLKDGFQGAAFPVNPAAESIAGVFAYPRVTDIPGDVDVAIIVVPANAVLDAVDQCAKKGVTGLVVISAGFGETGTNEGKERERQLLEKALQHGMRIIGPNCLGILNNSPAVSLNATFSPVTPPFGNISIGTQSGALGLALLDHAKGINLGLACFVSFGNCADISGNDLLEYWEDDPDTEVITLYMESFGSPRKFGRTARRVTRKKPIIAVKAGKSSVGAAAATSHTGALAASDVAADALFKQAGVIRVTTIAEMFNAAEFLSRQPLPAGPNVCILTNAGGPGVLAADACEALGLKVPPLSAETQKKLREFLPPSAAVKNPVDMIASATADAYAKSLSTVLDDAAIDSVIVIYIPPLVTRPGDIAEAVKECLAAKKPVKPVIPCFMMSEQMMSELRRDPRFALHPYLYPEDAVQSLSHAYHYSVYKNMEEGRHVTFAEIDAEKIRRKLFAKPPEKGWLMPETALSLVKEYGIPIVRTEVAESRDELLKAAEKTGYPFIMKLRSSTIIHKTDAGGISYVRNPDEAIKAFDAMQRRLTEKGRLSEMQGVLLQPVVEGAEELIVGMSVDPAFGPLIMIGLGGILVELVKDIAFAIHPLRDIDPEKMLNRLKSLPLLTGYRGRPKADLKAIKDALLRFSTLIEDFPEIEQMEINPLFALKEGSGCLAADVRIYMKGPS